ncbi:unnamed protein product, partial [marine sediment metagenome]
NEVVSLVATSRNLGENYAKLVELLGAPSGNGHGKYKENAGFRDRLILEHRDKTGKVIATRDSGWQDHKCLTNTGFASVAALLLLDVGDTGYDYVAIGTGVGAADPTDATLGTETHREAGTGTRVMTDVANDTAQLVATFSGYGGSEAITESGCLNAAVAGILLCRQKFDPLNLDWAALDSLSATWKVQAKAAA